MANEILLSNIRQLCKKRNITVAFLEKELDIGAGTISRWNKAAPSMDRVVSIAQFFGVSVDTLVGYGGKRSNSYSINDQTQKVVDYLIDLTTQAGEKESFWLDYSESCPLLNISAVQRSCNEKDRILYACDETGAYLLVVSYQLDECYEYEMKCRLYLMPDENEEPLLECSEKEVLHALVIEALNRLRNVKRYTDLKDKAAVQREKILERYKELH